MKTETPQKPFQKISGDRTSSFKNKVHKAEEYSPLCFSVLLQLKVLGKELLA